jgi:hypothetical protein
MSNFLQRLFGETQPRGYGNALDMMLQDIERAPLGASRVGQRQAQVTAPAPGGFDPVATTVPAPLARQGVTQGRADQIEAQAFDAAMNWATVTPMGFRVYHGTGKLIDRPSVRFAGRNEPALFFSDNPLEARGFGPNVYRALVDDAQAMNVRWRDFDSDPIYDPEIMKRILQEAQRARKNVVRISGVQNFEGGPLSSTVAVLNDDAVLRFARIGSPEFYEQFKRR